MVKVGKTQKVYLVQFSHFTDEENRARKGQPAGLGSQSSCSDWVWALLLGTRSATIQTLDGEEVKWGGVGPSRGSEARRGIWGFILTARGKTPKGFLA